MPYYHGCVEYYSPSASIVQMVYAFIAGLVVAFMIHQVNTKEDPVPEDPAGLQTQLDEARALIVKLEGQRDRAFHAAMAIIAVVWLGTCFAIVSNKSSVGPPYYFKTEL